MAVIESYSEELFSISHSIDSSPDDKHFKPHIHNNLELFCLVRGQVDYIVEGNIYKLRPGAIMLMRSGETHKLIVNNSEEYERYVFNFNSNLFSQSLLEPYFNRDLGTRNLYVPKEFQIPPISIFKKVFFELALPNKKEVILSSISSLLSSICFAFLKKEPYKTVDSNINSAIAYINENLTSDISLNDVAKVIHLSMSQTNRIFKKVLGKTVYDYILTKRLILFDEKIKDGKNATTASLECGFVDYSSFYRLYKKRFGISPTSK
jgi:AraC-like DNA-binding protein